MLLIAMLLDADSLMPPLFFRALDCCARRCHYVMLMLLRLFHDAAVTRRVENSMLRGCVAWSTGCLCFALSPFFDAAAATRLLYASARRYDACRFTIAIRASITLLCHAYADAAAMLLMFTLF